MDTQLETIRENAERAGDLLSLVDLLRMAEGPDRELDLAIMRAISGHKWRWHRSFPAQTVITWDEYGEYAAGNPVVSLEIFTESLADAVTLVPEGWEWLVSNRAPSPHTGRAYINNRQLHFIGAGTAKNPNYRGLEYTAATPAMALCAAAIAARLP
jgi:hypothetical protein